MDISLIMDLLLVITGFIIMVRGIFLIFVLNEQNVFKYFKRLRNTDVNIALSKGKFFCILAIAGGSIVILSSVLRILRNTGL